jgi:hypothetical protein
MTAGGPVQDSNSLLLTVLLILVQITNNNDSKPVYTYVHSTDDQDMERVVKYIRIKCTSARILYDYEITI